MPQELTLDDIWKLFRETNRIFQESKEKSERDREKSERDLEETRRILRESSAEADRRSRETDRKFREMERVVKDVSRQIGQLGGRWGEFVEGMVAPACETLFLDRGIPVHRVHQRVKAKYPGNRHMEIDLLVVNTDVVVLVEVKSKLRVEDVREHVTRLAEFKSFFPEYVDRRVMGAVAGIVVEENVEQFAMNEGLFVIVQSGETVTLANDTQFIPKTW
ncbi:MAG: DUF3782 domain-containing protein [Magnetococcales bacterium]|nr:DUF3782 domain-containing protein [Magnetococcales bacterium]